MEVEDGGDEEAFDRDKRPLKIGFSHWLFYSDGMTGAGLVLNPLAPLSPCY